MIEIAQHLKESAEKLVAEIGQGIDHKKLHSTALNVLMSSVELIRELESSSQNKPDSQKAKAPQITNAQEVSKVEHRLKLWANRPHQINHLILKKWLELAEAQNNIVTEDDLANAVLSSGLEGGSNSFNSNFVQMKTIAEKNHGKVFDVKNGNITIWEPVEKAVFEFKFNVFNK